MIRESKLNRETGETRIQVRWNLDGSGTCQADTQIPFLDHMLAQLARHGLFDIEVHGRGDLEVDYHHLVEDVGISLGLVLRQILGDMKGIERFGHAITPLDESLAMVALDFSGRGYLETEGAFREGSIRDFELALLEEFFRAFAMNAGVTLHIRMLSGVNAHHKAEAVFKGFAKALRDATRVDPRASGIPSTKGVL